MYTGRTEILELEIAALRSPAAPTFGSKCYCSVRCDSSEMLETESLVVVVGCGGIEGTSTTVIPYH